MKSLLIFLVSTLVLGTLLTACGPTTIYTQPGPVQRSITVTGTGMVTLTPDIAYVYIGVQTSNESASAAMSANNEQAQAVIEMIKTFGVEERDIQTTNFSIYPQQVYDQNYNVIGVTYVVTNTVSVTVRDLSNLGQLLDSVVRSGANSINGISFDVEDKSQAISQARQAAVEDARRQAEQLSSATGVSLGEVQTISYYDSNPVPYVEYARAESMAMDSSVPVQAGSMQVTTTVTIVYGLE
jgi:uncharacterized protein YggE